MTDKITDNGISALYDALPAPPDWRYDFTALEALPALAPLIAAMSATPQDPVWHGEGDVWTHTRLVCEALAGLEDIRLLPECPRRALLLAALLHDIGKIRCTRVEGGRIVTPSHGSVGARMARTLLWTRFGLAGTPEALETREACCALIRYHSLPLHLYEKNDPTLSARRFASVGEKAPGATLLSLTALAEADVLGRFAPDREQLLDAVKLAHDIGEEAGCLSSPYHFASAATREKYFSGAKIWPDQELYDDSVAEAVLLSGLPGVGKDTYIRGRFPSLPVVSLDQIRRRMGVSPRDDQGRVVQAAREEAREYLRRGQPFVWNATSLTRNRRDQVALFSDYRFRTRIVYLETSWQENLRRNSERRDKVPESVIASMLDKLEVPLPDEAREVEWVTV